MLRLFRTPPFATVFVVGLCQEIAFFLLVNLPGRLQQLGLGPAGIGFAYSASALAALALRPWLGRVLDVVHRRTVLRVAGIANASVIAALAFIDVAGPPLWAAFLAQRILQIALFTTLLTYAADAIPVELRARGLAIFGMSGLIPIATSNLAGDALIGAFDYPGLLLAAAAVALGAWLLVWRLPLLPVLGERPRRSFWAVMTQRDMLPLWWITFVFSMGLETLFTFTRTFIDERGVGSMGWFFLVYGGVAVAARLGGGGFYDRFAHRHIVVTAVLGEGVGMLVVAAAAGIGVLTLGAALLGAAHGTVFPILANQVVDRARSAERGSAMATFTSVFDIALLVVAPLIGVVIDAAGYTVAFSSLGVALGLGAAVYGRWDRRTVAVPGR